MRHFRDQLLMEAGGTFIPATGKSKSMVVATDTLFSFECQQCSLSTVDEFCARMNLRPPS